MTFYIENPTTINSFDLYRLLVMPIKGDVVVHNGTEYKVKCRILSEGEIYFNVRQQ